MSTSLELEDMLKDVLDEGINRDEIAASVVISFNKLTVRTNPIITNARINNELVSRILEKRIFATPLNEQVCEIPVDSISAITLVFVGHTFEGTYKADISKVWPYKD